MALNSCVLWGPVRKRLFGVAMLALMVPAASWANNAPIICNPGTVCIANDQGTITGTSSGLTLSGSVVTQIGNLQGSNLGSLSLSTGGLASGSLTTGGTFNAGGSIQITDSSGSLFSGQFSSAVTWTAQNVITHINSKTKKVTYSCGTGGCIYVLSGTIAGMYGANGLPVTGGTIQQTINTKTPFASGGSVSLENGSTFIVTPEPGTLSLMGTGLIGLAGLVKRRLVRKSDT